MRHSATTPVLHHALFVDTSHRSALHQAVMSHGEFLTKLAVWLALIAYAFGAGMLLAARGQPK